MAIMDGRASLNDAVASHYHLVAPIMERLFGRIPIVWTTFLNDPDRTKTFHRAQQDV